MKNDILNQSNQNGYGKKAYNHVKKKGGIFMSQEAFILLFMVLLFCLRRD